MVFYCLHLSLKDYWKNENEDKKEEQSCNPKSIDAFPRIIPVEPPIVNINKKRRPKKASEVLSCKNGGLPRYVLNQLKILVPVGKDIKIVTPVK